jgi:hypothetical protein
MWLKIGLSYDFFSEFPQHRIPVISVEQFLKYRRSPFVVLCNLGFIIDQCTWKRPLIGLHKLISIADIWDWKSELPGNVHLTSSTSILNKICLCDICKCPLMALCASDSIVDHYHWKWELSYCIWWKPPMLNLNNSCETGCTMYEIVHLYFSVNQALLMINMAEMKISRQLLRRVFKPLASLSRCIEHSVLLYYTTGQRR